MAKSMFLDKAAKPDREMIAAVLGTGIDHWDAISSHIEATYPSVTTEWKYYGRAWGWCLVYKSKNKALVYLTPADGAVICSFIFGEKAREAAQAADLPQSIKQAVAESVNNNAGHTFDVPALGTADVALVKRLLEIKVAN